MPGDATIQGARRRRRSRKRRRRLKAKARSLAELGSGWKRRKLVVMS
jgi:hypothetical protein